MKIVLETIPVWDGVKRGEECFLCSLAKEAERDAISYYLSSAIMTPEVRVETNTYGFCPHHMRALAEGGRPQALSLVMDTYYDENRKHLGQSLSSIISASKLRKAEKSIDEFESAWREREKGCLVCTRIEDRLYRYSFTVAALFDEDAEFRKALEESKGFCLEHTLLLSRTAKDALSGDRLLSYYKTIFSLLERNLDRVQHDDWWMSQMYKSENRDKDWAGCEDAHKRAVYKLVSECSVIDPLKNKKTRI